MAASPDRGSAPPETASSDQPIAALEEVHLSFGDSHILKGVTLNCRPRERLAVLGKSGGGKSTLLRLVLGILRPQQGQVRFKSLDVLRMSRRRLNSMRQKIGMVYQYSALISSLSVRENLALPAEELTDEPPDKIEHLVEEKLRLVGMLESIDKMPAELSGGMKKRIGLARAIMLDPELILYDEPSAGLDPVTSATIDDLMISLSEQVNAASIIVTHEMDSAFKVATRMCMLHEGRVQADGSPEEFRDHPDPIVAQFVSGNPVGPLTEENSTPSS